MRASTVANANGDYSVSLAKCNERGIVVSGNTATQQEAGMPLNAREFRKRSEDFFAATYLNSVGIIQNVALGVLMAKFYTGTISPQSMAHVAASFLAIVIIANEYSWWILLIRRTPGVFDYLIPYALGAVEFGVMAKADNIEGEWFLVAGALALMGALSLAHNHRYATSEIFVRCKWLLPRVRRNLLIGIILLIVAAVVMLGGWYFHEHLTNTAKVVVFVSLYAIQIAMLIVTTIFLRGVRDRFDAE